jgi:sugar lactone lactonase YvrE
MSEIRARRQGACAGRQGPVWDERRQVLWIDVKQPRLLRSDPPRARTANLDVLDISSAAERTNPSPRQTQWNLNVADEQTNPRSL